MKDAQSPTPWHEAVMRLHIEAAGLLNLDVVRRIDMPHLVSAALTGDADAADLVRLVSDALRGIEDAPAAESKQCARCAAELSGGRFALVIAKPAVSDPQRHLVMAICPRCGTSPGGIKAAATAALRLIWPDVREVRITHGEGGRA